MTAGEVERLTVEQLARELDATERRGRPWEPSPAVMHTSIQSDGSRVVTVDSWPHQIEIDRGFLALADPLFVTVQGLEITFRVHNGTSTYRVVGYRGEDVLKAELLSFIATPVEGIPIGDDRAEQDGEGEP